MKQHILKIDPADTVGVALTDLKKGTTVHPGIRTRRAVPAGHKVALVPHQKGAAVVKYGDPIGVTTCTVPAGEWIHSHNMRSGLSGAHRAYRYTGPFRASTAPDTATFRGYRRADGRTGTRNQVWIINTVHCINRTAENLAARANARFKKTKHFDGFAAFPHPYGCSQVGDDLENTRTILGVLARHPNAGGVLVLALGCENNDLATFIKKAGLKAGTRIRMLTLQETPDEEAAAMRELKHLYDAVRTDRRTVRPVTELTLGVKCGGSDAFSGITANPLIGTVSDRLAAAGGTVLMGEVPEMFGAEHLLMARAAGKRVFKNIVSLVTDFKDYFTRWGVPVYENPSPGNRKGGITTLEEKSLGCTKKGGNARVTDVLAYGRPARVPGLNLVDCPGNDGVSTTALTAAGAVCILFSTGRGTPFGAPVPTLKLATNPGLARRKPGWIDFDAGALLAGASMETAHADLWRTILCTASGEPAKNETNGHADIVIFKNGVTL